MSGRRLGAAFRCVEVEERADPDVVWAMLSGAEDQPVLHVVRNAAPAAACARLRDNFWSELAQHGTSRPDEVVPVVQIGATQFTRSAGDYIRDAAAAAPRVERLFAGVSPADQARLLHEPTLAEVAERCGGGLRAARFGAGHAGRCAARSWRNVGALQLEPHEDAGQLEQARDDDFEIGDVAQVVAAVVCVANGGGGELVVWDIAPDAAARLALGLERSGYPYPRELVAPEARLAVELAPGDGALIAAGFVHAVRAARQRVSVSRFHGLLADGQVVWWT